MISVRHVQARASAFVAAMLAVAVVASAQTQAPVPAMRGDGPAPQSKPFNVTRADPGLDAIVSTRATAEELARGFGLNEGPVWVREGDSGYLLVGGLIDNVIYKIAADRTVSVFLEAAGSPAPTSITPARRRAAGGRTSC